MSINLKGIYGQASSKGIQSVQQKFQLFCVIRNASKGLIQVLLPQMSFSILLFLEESKILFM